MAQDLLDYETTLKDKLRIFRERLADKGILVAQANVSQGFGSYIAFYREDGADSVTVVAKEVGQIISSWLRYGTEMYVYISPLLMAEFGAGSHAVYWEDSKGSQSSVLSDGTEIGRGSFPDQTHADEDSWWYMDLNKDWHRASGVTPTRPMHNAVIEIVTQVERTAREVFGNG
jgi:hypothetical protein